MSLYTLTVGSSSFRPSTEVLLDFVIDPLVSAVTAAVLTRTGEGVANLAASAVTALRNTIRNKLGRDSLGRDSLGRDSLGRDSLDRDRPGEIDAGGNTESERAALAEALQQAIDEDPSFRARIQSLWQQAQVEISASGEVVHVAGRDVIIDNRAPAGLPDVVTPSELPPVPAVFVNRITEQARLDGSGQDSAGPRMVVLSGMVGIGKSALAVRWGTTRLDRFPGGQVYADYQSVCSDEVVQTAASASVLRDFLRSFGVPEGSLNGGLERLTRQYRTLLQQRAKAVLVVVDGATEPAQVRALVPTTPGSMVVVSSEYDMRELVVTDHAELIDVNPLSTGEGVELLTAICGRERIAAASADATRLVELCDGHAGALHVAGARLLLDPTLPIADLADALTDPRGLAALTLPGRAGRQVHGSIVSLFTLTYQRLGEDARQLYRDLGGLPILETSDELLAAIGWTDPTRLRHALDDLLAARLLHRTVQRQYRQHALLRAHAGQLAELQQPRRNLIVSDAAVVHLATRTWLAARAIMGERLLLVAPPGDVDTVVDPFTGPARRRTALGWLETNRDTLWRALEHAARVEADDLAMRLAESLQALYLNHRHAADWIAVNDVGVRVAGRRGRRDVEARLRSLISRLYTDLGDLRRARREIEAALALVDGAENLTLVASVHEFHGRFLSVAEPARAVAAFEKAIAMHTAADVPRGAALGRFFLGCHLLDHERPADARPVLEQARRELNAAGDERMSARADAAIGRALLRTGELRRARMELHVAADYFAAEELWHYEVPVRSDLAEAYEALDDPLSAGQHRGRADAIKARLGEP